VKPKNELNDDENFMITKKENRYSLINYLFE